MELLDGIITLSYILRGHPAQRRLTMDLQKTMAALAGGKAAVVDVTSLVSTPTERTNLPDEGYQRDVTLG